MDATRILVVDDDDVDQELLTRLLRKLSDSHEIVVARSLIDAEELLTKSQFECVFIDYNLGGRTGLDLLPAITAHRPEICPVILVTLDGSNELIVEAMRSGVADYVSKARLDLDNIRITFERVMARAAAEQQRRNAETEFARLTEAMRHSHETAMRVAIDRAESANKAKSRFLANMSHEIRTPLNAVIGLSYLLGKTQLNEEQADLAAKIAGASKTLLALVNEVLDLSKIEASQMEIEEIPFSLRELTDNLRGLIHTQITDKEILFEVEIEDELADRWIGDPARLHQILLNLLSNAAKFTQHGYIRLSIQAAEEKTGRFVRFTVADSGVGIDASALEHLFEPFVQADNSITRHFGGSGLGLSIARDLIGLMGGEIGVKSSIGVGSNFWFKLPLIPFAEEHQPDPRHRCGTSGGKPRRLLGLHILLVDDSPLNLEVAGRILEMEGAKVQLASNGNEAVDFVINQPLFVDVILMDLQMPVLDGYTAFRQIEAVLGSHRPLVLALSAGAVDESDAKGIGGMDGRIPKPFDVDQLVNRILEVVDRRKSAMNNAVLPLPSVCDLTTAWPELEGFDIADAYMRLNGDWTLFHSALSRLTVEYVDLEKSKPAELRSRLHRLKGNAGLLGATRLAELAADAERVYKDKSPINAQPKLAALSKELQRLGQLTARQDA